VATGVDHGRGRPRASGTGQGRSYPGGPRQKGAASPQWWALAAGEEGGTEGGLAPAADFDSGVQPGGGLAPAAGAGRGVAEDLDVLDRGGHRSLGVSYESICELFFLGIEVMWL
jgi:hypothetical protein